MADRRPRLLLDEGFVVPDGAVVDDVSVGRRALWNFIVNEGLDRILWKRQRRF